MGSKDPLKEEIQEGMKPTSKEKHRSLRLYIRKEV